MKKLTRIAPVLLALALPLAVPLPANAQQFVNATIDPDAQLLNSNQMEVSGSLTCRLGAQASVFVEVTQQGTAGNTFSFVFPCNVDGQQPFSAVVTSFGNTFHSGKGHVTVQSNVFSQFGEFLFSQFAARDVHVSK